MITECFLVGLFPPVASEGCIRYRFAHIRRDWVERIGRIRSDSSNKSCAVAFSTANGLTGVSSCIVVLVTQDYSDRGSAYLQGGASQATTEMEEKKLSGFRHQTFSMWRCFSGLTRLVRPQSTWSYLPSPSKEITADAESS